MKSFLKAHVLGLLILCVLIPPITFVSTRLAAQSAAGEVLMQFVPATNTDVITITTPNGYLVDQIMLSNTSASSVTCNVRDRSTNCGGAACQFWPNITLDANSLQMMTFGGATAVGGIAWSCSTGSVVIGSIRGRR